MRHSLFPAVFLVSTVLGLSAHAALHPDQVRVADTKKTNAYVADGLVTGGDRAIDEVIVRDVRRAPNAGYERVVIDLEGTRQGDPVAIPRPPYYQVAVSPGERRVVFTVWGKPKLAFDAKKVQNAFRKSATVESIDLFPRMEDESWTFAMNIKPGRSVEVFELGNPVRVILDIHADKVKR